MRNAYYIKSAFFTIREDVRNIHFGDEITLFVRIDISQTGGIIDSEIVMQDYRQ